MYSREYYEKVSSDAEAEKEPLAGGKGYIAAARTACLLRVQIISVCVAYAIIGPTLVLVNNHILKQLDFPFPLILSVLGLLVTAVVCAMMVHVLPRLRALASRRRRLLPPDDTIGSPGTPRSSLEAREAGEAGVSLAERAPSPIAERGPSPGGLSSADVTFQFWLWNMVPIGAAQGLTFASTNAAYMYLTITFTQMLAAFTPTVTLVLLYVSGIEVPTRRAALAVLLIGVGCALSSYGEVHFSVTGVFFRSVGIFSEATRLVLTQRLLKNFKLSIFESQYYLAPVGAGFLLIGAAFTEFARFHQGAYVGTIWAHKELFAASAILGVAASMLTFLVIKLTNSVTLKVINTARNAAFVLFTVVVMGEAATGIQIAGYTVSLGAFSAYLYVKLKKL